MLNWCSRRGILCKVVGVFPIMSGSQKRVQSTNDSSILSKYSMVKAGYFKDDFLKHFVTKDARRSPLINRGYYIRMKAVDNMLRIFLTSKEFDKKQVISLGAGFDTSFFRFNAEGLLQNSCKFYEIDYPDVVKIKKSFIKNEPSLCSAVGAENHSCPGVEGLHTDRYTLVGCNLKDLASLEKILLNCNIDKSCPTLLLSEVVLCYLDAKSSSCVINWAATFFSSAVFVTYEQVFPDDPFGVVMIKHFHQVGSPLRSITEFPTPEVQIHRYQKQRWDLVKYQNMVSFYKSLPTDEHQRIQQIEPFDEFEEWDLKCFHYIILAGFKGDCKMLSQKMYPENNEHNECSSTMVKDPAMIIPTPLKLASKNKFQRYGHSATLLPGGDVIIIGGFGELNNKHMRLKGINILRKETDVWKCKDAILTDDIVIGSRMFHSSTLINDNSILLYGGRTSPNKPCTSTCILKIEQRGKTLSSTKNNLPSDEHLDQQLTSGQTFDTPNSTSPLNNIVERNSDKTKVYNNEDGTVCTLTLLDPQGSGPIPRWRHTATRLLMDHEEKEKVLIFGGRTPTRLAINDCYILNITDNKWEEAKLQGEPAVPRHSHTACLWRNHHVILAGGLDKYSTALNLLQNINTADFTLNTLTITPPLRPRYSHTSHVINDNLVLIGGIDPYTTGSPSFTVVNLKSLTSSSLPLPVCPGQSPLMLHNHTSILIDPQTIMVFGGGGNCFSFGTHLNDEPFIIETSSLGLMEE
ncbi:tRNA wybutosine-synthesizing protein 4-like [Actinia tenebrosa]|uniref:tRNA wybutosine-synthesizing protein 4 n=1 Tax=Actinia tenebrosa TaxID=6105 RepID=A0A6P8IEF5_ACTTE|nr:tRNA wybutosine-synthesizing protein 4-like [Actinia tenebrosa]